MAEEERRERRGIEERRGLEDRRERRGIGLVTQMPRARDRRRRLPTVVRYLIIAVFGLFVAVLASYLLRSIGF